MTESTSFTAPVAGGLSTGVDLVSIDEVAQSIATFGERYTKRVFTAAERAAADGAPGVMAARLAARFAAKEAVLKACRPGDEAIPWLDIEILTRAGGAPRVRLHDRAARLARDAGLQCWSVSMTHERGLAAAIAVGWTPSTQEPSTED